MDNQELREYRTKLFRSAAIPGTPSEKIPHISYFVTWPIFDAGYTLSQAIYNYDIMEDALTQHWNKYRFDAIFSLGSRNPMAVSRQMGATWYLIDDEAGALNIKGYSLIEADRLKALADNPVKVLWEECMKTKYKDTWNDKLTLDFMQKVVDENDKFNAFTMRMNIKGVKEFANPMMLDISLGGPYSAYDFMFSNIRGIKGLSEDMRRCPEVLKEAAAALNELNVIPSLNKIKASTYGQNPGSIFDATWGSLAHNCMSNKQVEEFYWPMMKEYCDALDEKGKSLHIIFQGEALRFFYLFEDYKKETIVMHIENDDIYECYNKYPNFTYFGGFPLTYMGHKSPEECVAKARELVDFFKDKGGYIFCTDKMGSYPGDAKSENLKAVCDFMMDEQ